MNGTRNWYEFFAGGGMARMGLGSDWLCTFANDICTKKASAYRAFLGDAPELKVGDVARLTTKDLPGIADLVWASFPCQDLSLAGNGAGLNGQRSGTFRPFWRLISGLVEEGRAPKVVVLENVCGALTSHSGRDFTAIVRALVDDGYRVGALVINAIHFVPQSRPRLFVIGNHEQAKIPQRLIAAGPCQPWHTNALIRAQNGLPRILSDRWVWWSLPIPNKPVPRLSSLIERIPTGTQWHSYSETNRLLRLMTAAHRKKVRDSLTVVSRQIGTIYKRTRPGPNGVMAQRAEVRFDGISGCLRTPVGGSSRQTVVITEKGRVRTRLLSPREAARLMGVPDSYPLPSGYNDAYHIFGDGVVVPVVSWLNQYLLWPLAASTNLEQVA
ncbi:MAG: DNA cytosine methyltransferase [Candidatus Acidiferrales bacterium]